MTEKAMEIASLLLREGVLQRDDADHQETYAQLMQDTVLYDDVERRLRAVGYDLVLFLQHAGVRVSSEAVEAAPLRNRMGLDAGHIRLIVYLWIHLVYREVCNLRRNLESRAPGAEQRNLFAAQGGDDDLFISYRIVFETFAEHTARGVLLGRLRHLRRLRFIRFDEKRDRIWADGALYVLIDPQRMEDFVLDLARRLGVEDPVAAVSTVAASSPAMATAAEDAP